LAYPLTYRQFCDGLKSGQLLGLKCRSCGAYTVPPKVCCVECGSSEVAVVQMSGRGEIRTYTVIRVAPEGFKAPYIVAMVELDEGPWVMGNMEGLDLAKPVEDLTGKRVRVGHKVLPPAGYTGGEGVALTFWGE